MSDNPEALDMQSFAYRHDVSNAQDPLERRMHAQTIPLTALLRALAEIPAVTMPSDLTLKILKARSGPQGSISSRVWKSGLTDVLPGQVKQQTQNPDGLQVKHVFRYFAEVELQRSEAIPIPPPQHNGHTGH